jgi:hypothetical protein
MTIEQLRNVLQARPFKPFLMHLADGREIRVQHPESFWSVPSGRTVFISQPDDTVNIVDLLLVTDLEIPPTGQTARGSRRA